MRQARASFLVVASILAALGCHAVGSGSSSGTDEEKDYLTNIDYTQETRWSISLGDGRSHVLRTILPRLVTHHLFGEYENFSSGNRLYLFPTSEYAITSWCDVCEEDVLELGTWKLVDDEIELIAERSSGPGSAPYDLDFFRRVIGDFRSLRFFVTGEDVIEESVLVPAEKLQGSGEVRRLVRVREYIDWPAALQRLRSSVEFTE